MAVIFAGPSGYVRVNAIDLTSLPYGAITNASATSFTVDYGAGSTDRFDGVGMTYDAKGQPLGGTITAYLNSGASGLITEIAQTSVDVATFVTLAHAGDNDGELNLFLSGDDRFTGTAGPDFFDGRAGLDTVTYAGHVADYSVVKQTDGAAKVSDLRAGAPDGVDTLVNIERIAFADGTVSLQSVAATVQTEHRLVLRTDPTTGPNAAAYNSEVSGEQSGTLTDAQVIALIVELADATTSVATMAYQFFTGKTPTLAGLDYLVSPTGPNPNNINSAYYQLFNLENRYISFAVNLGKSGEGAAAFNASYGPLSLFDATRQAYGAIFGVTPTDAKLHALLDTRADYFAIYGGDGPAGIGAKAAVVGWLMGEAAKADVGVLETANFAYLTDLALGKIAGQVDLIGVYHGTAYTGG